MKTRTEVDQHSSMLTQAKAYRDLKQGKPIKSLPDNLGSFLLLLKGQGLRLFRRRQ